MAAKQKTPRKKDKTAAPKERARSPKSGRPKGWKADRPRAIPATILDHRVNGLVTAGEVARVIGVTLSAVIKRIEKDKIAAKDLGTKGAAYRWLVDLPAFVASILPTLPARGEVAGKLRALALEVDAYVGHHFPADKVASTRERLSGAARLIDRSAQREERAQRVGLVGEPEDALASVDEG